METIKTAFSFKQFQICLFFATNEERLPEDVAAFFAGEDPEVTVEIVKEAVMLGIALCDNLSSSIDAKALRRVMSVYPHRQELKRVALFQGWLP